MRVHSSVRAMKVICSFMERTEDIPFLLLKHRCSLRALLFGESAGTKCVVLEQSSRMRVVVSLGGFALAIFTNSKFTCKDHFERKGY